MQKLTPLRPAVRLVPALLATLLLSACGTLDGSMHRIAGLITPYRADVLQGNVVTKEQLDALRPGVSREQVRQVLGAPLLTDPFHADRWDYVFTIRRQGVETQRRSLVVFFTGDRMDRLEAPELPTENAFVASISAKPVSTAEVKLSLNPEERAALPLPPPREAAAAAAGPLGAARTYPPLESQ